ncbi:hypothetical protein NP233_g9731 [Leucocoprinus birnbaumii]|uniref:Aminotransferase class I/classII large domain-containing protein n=1 Tax=Leucocoprinus birnbaumii TaxID=56174 RepID=A0AAD5YSL4_9AGAR|nr:hypothetical protein NP233_g9731 [Leucocoprinus birnbaumii]
MKLPASAHLTQLSAIRIRQYSSITKHPCRAILTSSHLSSFTTHRRRMSTITNGVNGAKTLDVVQNAKERKPSPIRSLFPLEKTPGVISFLAGKPNPTMFPLTSLSFSARSPHSSSLEDETTYSLTSEDLALEVETDAHGISTTSLRSILENWPAGKPKPKVLYTVPYGCNPTGMTATLERRIEVLKLAREHEFIVLEDDPYFYLYYGTAPRTPSYFSLEPQILPETGRVLRFDSFSKVLSAGMRIGFASGPDAILSAIEKHTATSNLQVSSLTQVIAAKLLDSWGYEGYKTHTERVSEFYREKRDVFQAAMVKYLDGYAEWVKPEAGMFFCHSSTAHDKLTPDLTRFKLNLTSGSDLKDIGDSESVIRTTAFEKGVLALPGKVFLPNGNKTAYVRASFSLSPEADVYEALSRLRAALVEVRGE